MSPYLDPRPAACTCGAGDLISCLCGTTPAQWAEAARLATAKEN